MTAPIQTLTLREAAAALKVHPNTVRREIDRRKLRTVRVGRTVRIRVSEVEKYLDRN